MIDYLIWHSIRRLRSESSRFLNSSADIILGRKFINTNEFINFICNCLESNEKLAVGRLGNNEMLILFHRKFKTFTHKNYTVISRACGFNLRSKEELLFAKNLYMRCFHSFEFLICWQFVYRESEFVERLSNAKRIKPKAILDLVFDQQNRFGMALSKKKLAIVTSIPNSISNSLKNKDILQNNFWKTIGEVTYIKSNNPYDISVPWVVEFNRVCNECDQSDADVFFLSCGSLGFPLASYIKLNLNKSVFILGSYLLLAAGLQCSRFKADSEYNKYTSLVKKDSHFKILPHEISSTILETESGDYL